MCAEEPSAPERECLPLRPVYLSSAQDVSQGSKVTPLSGFFRTVIQAKVSLAHSYLKLIRNKKLRGQIQYHCNKDGLSV